MQATLQERSKLFPSLQDHRHRPLQKHVSCSHLECAILRKLCRINDD